MKRYYLICETGAQQRTIHPLVETATIGRDANNLIQLTDSTTSRNHAKVRFWQGSWMVEDLGSANGVIFGGERVEKALLKPGDSFRIGETTFSLVEREIAKSKDPLHTTVMVLSATIAGLESPAVGDGTDPRVVRLMNIMSVIPFFVPLQETEREQLARTARMHAYSAGKTIVEEGDPGRSIYVILNGRVKVFTRDHAGNELELTTLGVGHFFGVTSLLSGKPRSSSAVAIESSVLIEFSYAGMAEVIKLNVAVKNVLVQYYKARKRDSQEKVART